MDDPGDKQSKNTQRERKENSFLQRCIVNASDVLSSFWLRRTVQANNGPEWILLGGRFSFLFYFRMLLVIIYLTHEAFK